MSNSFKNPYFVVDSDKDEDDDTVGTWESLLSTHKYCLVPENF
jgi:hypothetical protein